MAPKLITEGKIQILGQTLNSVVYAVSGDADTGWARDSLTVLKGGSVWYERREALGPNKDADVSDKNARKEASIYEVLGNHECIIKYYGLELANFDGIEKAWAIRLERAPHGGLRDCILRTAASPPREATRLELARCFAEGVTHLHRCRVIWGDLSTRNALLFDHFRLKLGDFADADLMDKYPADWYGCEDRYCPPGSDRPQFHEINTLQREIFALGTAICEIMEWRVPYGPQTEVSEDEVLQQLVDGIWPQISCGNSAERVIRGCWEYKYESSQQVVDDLMSLSFPTSVGT